MGNNNESYRIVQDFQLISVSLVANPEKGMEIQTLMERDVNILIDKYDRTMKLLEMYINE